MPPPSQNEVTQLLLAWSDGDQTTLEELTPLVYAELRWLAERHMRRERAGHPLQTTALVNEANVWLIDLRRVRWLNREPNYGADGRHAYVKNYRYFYTRVNDRQCAIWAIPRGPRRHYASTFFIVLPPDWMRSWRGQAMSDEGMAQIPAIPSPTALTELRMQEMPSRVFGVNR